MLAALRSRDFRLLWLGSSASTIGDALILVAIGLYVTQLTGDASDVAVVLAAYALPLVALVTVGGVVADRFPRVRVMILSDIVRGLLHGVLALLILTGEVRIWHMVIIGVLFGSAEAFFRPAYSGLVPQTVEEEHIQGAQALGGVSREVASFVSPAIATALVLGVGGAAAFALDALTFAISALLLMRVKPRARGEAVESGSFVRELREGWRALRERTWVWATILGFSLSMFLALAPFFVLGASVAKEVYGSAAVYGWTNTAWGVGTLIGVLLGARWRPERPMRAATLCAAPWPAGVAVFALGGPEWVAYLAMVVAGSGIGLFVVLWETALAQRIPPHLLSRVVAWDWMGSLALLPAGYIVAGALAELVGGREVLLVGGVAGVVVMSLACLPRTTRELARIESEEGESAASLEGLGEDVRIPPANG